MKCILVYPICGASHFLSRAKGTSWELSPDRADAHEFASAREAVDVKLELELRGAAIMSADRVRRTVDGTLGGPR